DPRAASVTPSSLSCIPIHTLTQARIHIHTHLAHVLEAGVARTCTTSLSNADDSRGRVEGGTHAPLHRERLLQRHHHRPGVQSVAALAPGRPHLGSAPASMSDVLTEASR